MIINNNDWFIHRVAYPAKLMLKVKLIMCLSKISTSVQYKQIIKILMQISSPMSVCVKEIRLASY